MGAQTLGRYLARTVVSAWLVVSGLFLLSRSVGDRAATIQAAAEVNPRLSSAARRQLTRDLLRREGLDLPLFYCTFHFSAGWQWHGQRNQYHHWSRQVWRGDLGTSQQSGTPVTVLLGQALRYTLPLTTLAALFSAALGLLLATTLSLRPGWRPPVLAALHLVQALPLFLLASGLLLLLANPDALEWFPAFGLGTEAPSDGSWSGGRWLYYLTLPLLSLVLVSLPALVIQLDGALQQELGREYITTARAKGAARARIVWHHALRNALVPTVALLTELLPSMVAGSVVVEVLFALPGMGRLLAEAATAQDYPVLLGAVTLVVVARLLAQLLADALYQVVDPRISTHT